MARFYGGVQGNRGEATRLGTANSDINAWAQGWNLGAKIVSHIDENGEDCFHIYINSGSNGGQSIYLAKITRNSEGIQIHLPDGLPVEIIRKFIKSASSK